MANITQFENVTFTVAGANPQSRTVQVAFSVNPTTGVGTATANFAYTGTNGGTDTVTASLPAFSYTSNPATVAWQPTNGIIAVSNPITVGIVGPSVAAGWSITSPQAFIATDSDPGSLYLNTTLSVDTRHNVTPSSFNIVTAQGAFSGG